MSAPKNRIDLFRRFMPKQFARTTKLCPGCGLRVQWNDKERALWCRRCKRSY